MTRIASFEPIVGEAARLLILGSMPSSASLAAGQYYAHPRNAFWKIASAILGFPPSADYQVRTDALKRSGIALWDVLHSCVRDGSLDADIESGSVCANDIRGLLQRQPGIGLVCFNGSTAERFYKAHVLPELTDTRIRYLRLPSTSPAHAALSFEQKLGVWRAAICASPHRH